jgi:5-(carboxyamino)imidazole ribonucleotide mutase
VAQARVAIIYGSPSDANVMGKAGVTLNQFGVGYEEVSISAHRAPRTLVDWIAGLAPRGIEVLIAGAGLSAALPGIAAAHTDLPVIGVPLTSSLTAAGGLDAILSIVQMPPGVPVATVGINAAANAAYLAVQVLSLSDAALAERFATWRREQSARVDTFD